MVAGLVDWGFGMAGDGLHGRAAVWRVENACVASATLA